MHERHVEGSSARPNTSDRLRMSSSGDVRDSGAGFGITRVGQDDPPTKEYGGTSWRVLLAFAGLSVTTPLVLFTAPAVLAGMQIVLGGGLAAATWVIVTYPTEKAKERLASDRVQPEMHLVLGTLLPELAVNLEKLLLWTDLSLRKNGIPAYLRYPVLNFIAYITGPLWFALLMLALVFFILVVTVISFGLILPLSVPILGLLLGYFLMIPVWVFSVYFLSMPPLIIATFLGCLHEVHTSFKEVREAARARRMVKQRGPSSNMRSIEGRRQRSESGGESNGQQRTRTSAQAWLTKKDLLLMYQKRGLLDVPLPIHLPSQSVATRQQEAAQERAAAEQQWAPAAGAGRGDQGSNRHGS